MIKITTQSKTKTLIIIITSIMVAMATLVSLIDLISKLQAVATSPNDSGCYEFNANGPLTQDPTIRSKIFNAYEGACFLTPGSNRTAFDCWDGFGLFNKDATFAKCKQMTASATGRHYYCPTKTCPAADTPLPPTKTSFYYCRSGSIYCNVGDYTNENECKTTNNVTKCYTDEQSCSNVCTPPPPPPPPPIPGNPYYFCASYSASVCTSANFLSKQACQDQLGLPCFDNQTQCSTRSSTNCPNSDIFLRQATYYFCNSSTDTSCASAYQTLDECQRAGHTCYVVNTMNNRNAAQICKNNIPKDCPPPINQYTWWCDTPNSCKSNQSGATPPTGAKTYTSQSECLNQPATDCKLTVPSQPTNFYWCNPNSTSTCNIGSSCPSGKKCYTSPSSCTTNYSNNCPNPSAQTGCCLYGFFKRSGQMTQTQCNAKFIHKWCGVSTTCGPNNTCGPVTPIDLCPNISGTQSSMPNGIVADSQGDCVNLVWWYNSQQNSCVSGAKTDSPAGSITYNTAEECQSASVPPPQGKATISGIIKAENTGDFPTSGGPISGASVTLYKNTIQIGPTTSDSSGNFSFTNLSDGQYGIQITANNYLTYCSQVTAPSSNKNYSLFPTAQPNNGSEGGIWDCKNGRPPLKPAMQVAVACLIDKTNELLGDTVKLNFTSFGRCNPNGSVDCHTFGLAADFIPKMNGSSFLQNCQPFQDIANKCGLYFIDERKDPIVIGKCGSSNIGPFKSGAHYHTQIGQSCNANNLPPDPQNPYTCNQ